MDDLGIFTNIWEYHIKALGVILQKLREDSFTINPLNCEWAVKETDWLGYWLTPRFLKAMEKED